MGKFEQVTVALPVEAIEAVRKAVAAGEYSSEADALAAAVRAWADVREVASRPDDELAALWDDGVSSGPGRFPGIDDLIAEAEQRRLSRAHRV